MILQGFEIENWACIRKLSVTNLPSSGVIVLHGPNRTGKSSIVRALRACLMDYASTSTALKSAYPRGSGDKPLVGVTFTSGGKTYRVRKWFGSSKSELALQTSTDAWKVESNTSAEVHSRMCELAGGDDSSKGLRQLLWLTQAEFQLPEAKKFDAGVQAQLRGILGVLQTPLDDRFIVRVKERWNKWFADQRKAGKNPALKKTSELARNLERFSELQAALSESEQKFNEIELLVRQAGSLETEKLRLARELDKAASQLKDLLAEQKQSQTRIANRKHAEERYAAALKEQQAAAAELEQRQTAASSLVAAESALAPAKQKVAGAEQQQQALLESQTKLNTQRNQASNERRDLQQRANRVAAAVRSLDDEEKLKGARAALVSAQEIASEIETLKKHLADRPAPTKAQVDALSQNRQRVVQLQAARDAASMSLTITPVANASPAQLSIDTADPVNGPASTATFSVRHRATVSIPNWGTIELSRGSSATDLDKIESDLQRLHDEFASGLTPFGIAPTAVDALDQLLKLGAEQSLQKSSLQTQEGLFKKAAPAGLEPLQRNVTTLETRLKSVPATAPAEALPSDRAELDALQNELQSQIEALDTRARQCEEQLAVAADKLKDAANQVTTAKAAVAGADATANSRREQLARLPAEAQTAERVATAERGLQEAEKSLTESALTSEELTIDERVSVGEESVRALERQIVETDEKYNRIRGRLEGVEGLHKERSELAAKAELFSQLTTAETLEKEAIDRLYELFEESRDKQLGTLMAPVEQRVLNWMRALDLGDYRELRFSDAFLPEQLIRRDGTADFRLDEESTGAQEQIGMLVRLALGSLLTTAADPALAILDDPLTHADAGRLANMRRILRRAAEGDAKLTPPAGPLQILVLTCHPEWFRDEQATLIDLENPTILQRMAG